MDNQGTFIMAVMLALYFAIFVLYVRKTKHTSRSLWKSLVWCVVFLVGFSFVAAYALAGLAGSISLALGYIFQIEPYASAATVKATVTILAVIVSFPAFYLGHKSIQKPDRGKNIMKGISDLKSSVTS